MISPLRMLALDRDVCMLALLRSLDPSHTPVAPLNTYTFLKRVPLVVQ